MLENRDMEYFPKMKRLEISGLPPEGWDELTTEEQFEEINKAFGFKVEVKSVKFEH